MSKRPYQHLPPLEHRPDGSPYRITPPQKRRASGLIRRECCNCEDGNCLALDDGDTCACPQMISFSVCCKWFRWAVLPLDRTLEAEIYRDRDLKRCAECGGVFVPKSNRGKYCPDCAARVHRRQKTESERKSILVICQELFEDDFDVFFRKKGNFNRPSVCIKKNRMSVRFGIVFGVQLFAGVQLVFGQQSKNESYEFT